MTLTLQTTEATNLPTYFQRTVVADPPVALI